MLKLYLLTLSDEHEEPVAIPFWWDGETGTKVEVVRQVIEKYGENVLTVNIRDAILEDTAEMIDTFSIDLVPWDLEDMPRIGNPDEPCVVPFTLKEENPLREVKGQFMIYPHNAGIAFDGYATATMNGPKAEVVAIEIYEEQLRVMLWSDEKKEDPTIISLEAARDTGGR